MTQAEGELLNRLFLGHTNVVFIFSSQKILPNLFFFLIQNLLAFYLSLGGYFAADAWTSQIKQTSKEEVGT